MHWEVRLWAVCTSSSSCAIIAEQISVVFLTVFCILFLLVAWSYTMVGWQIPMMLTSLLSFSAFPGRDHITWVCDKCTRNPVLRYIRSPIPSPSQFVETTERPGHQPMHGQLSSTLDDTPGMSYELLSPKVDLSHNPSPQDSDTRITRDRSRNDRLRKSSTSGTSVATPAAASQGMVFQFAAQQQNTNTPEEVHVTDVLANLDPLRVPNLGVPPSHVTSHQTSFDSPQPTFSRQPSMKLVLLPENRYCSKDKIIKPPRAHHCRACGTVGESFFFF